MAKQVKVDTKGDDQLLIYMRDFKQFASDCLYVRDHNTASIVPFRFNRGQEILHAVAEKQKAEQGHVHIMLLKSRRFGGSTYVEGRFYWLTSLNFNRNTFIIGHQIESTNTLFNMAKLYHERNILAPAIRRSNEKVLLFDTEDGKGLKSEYRLATADNVDAGRSQGIHYLHGSEEAFWRDGETLLTGVLQCIPDSPAESEIFRESTANGYGNTFAEDVFDTYSEGAYPYYEQNGRVYAWKAPNSDKVLVFIPWFDIERYSKDFDTDYQRQEFEAEISKKVLDRDRMIWVESEEVRLQKKYNLTLEQLHWRKWAIDNKCRGSVDKFHQEYPSTVEEAFLTTGSNVFGKELCDELEGMCRPPLLTGDLRRLGGSVKVKPNVYGQFKLWEKPNAEDSYFIVVDCAGGRKLKERDRKKIAKEPDRTNIDIINHRTGNQAAQWNGHIQYDLIHEVVEMIGDMYFRAVACVERNNHGYTVVADLDRAKYPQYRQENDDPGWSTTTATKPRMVDDGYKMVRDGDIKINCKETISEMRTFVEDPPGQYNASGTNKDDRVDTVCIASQMMLMLPRKYVSSDKIKHKQGGFDNWNRKNTNRDDGKYKEVYVS